RGAGSDEREPHDDDPDRCSHGVTSCGAAGQHRALHEVARPRATGRPVASADYRPEDSVKSMLSVAPGGTVAGRSVRPSVSCHTASVYDPAGTAAIAKRPSAPVTAAYGWSRTTSQPRIQGCTSQPRRTSASPRAGSAAARRRVRSIGRPGTASAKDRKSTRLNSSHQIISYAVF